MLTELRLPSIKRLAADTCAGSDRQAGRLAAAGGRGGASAIHPAILVALWLWGPPSMAWIRRARSCGCGERGDAHRWICTGVGVNDHSLANFPTAREAWLHAQLTRSITSLLDRRLVTLNAVAQDGLRGRAHVKASSFRRHEKLSELRAQVEAQVCALNHELTDYTGASAWLEQAAVGRAQRLAAALPTMDKPERTPPPEP